eukprot:COSAG01_NODE_31043_length_604_cov_12.582178_1_plen_92_part_00
MAAPTVVPSPVLPHGFCLRGAPRAQASTCAEMRRNVAVGTVFGRRDCKSGKREEESRKFLLVFIGNRHVGLHVQGEEAGGRGGEPSAMMMA